MGLPFQEVVKLARAVRWYSRSTLYQDRSIQGFFKHEMSEKL